MSAPDVLHDESNVLPEDAEVKHCTHCGGNLEDEDHAPDCPELSDPYGEGDRRHDEAKDNARCAPHHE